MNDLESVIDQLKDSLHKTAVTNASYTFNPALRSIFNPENLDPIVKLMTPTATPLRGLINRSKGYGQAANWKMLTTSLAPGATYSGMSLVGTGTSAFFADGGQPSQTTQTFVVKTAAYVNIGRDVEVGRMAIASSKGYQDIRDELVRYKTLEVMLGEEDAILNGNNSVDNNAFNGLGVQIQTNTSSAFAGGYLTASGIGSVSMNVYWNYGGVSDVLVVNPRQAQALADNLQGTGSIQRIVVDNQGAGIGGIRLAKIVHPITGTLIDVIPSRYVGGNGFLLDLADDAGQPWIEMEDLEGLSVYEPPTANHSIISRVYETTVLKVIGEVKQAKLTSLSIS